MTFDRKTAGTRPHPRIREVLAGVAALLACVLISGLLHREEPGFTALIYLNSVEIMRVPLRDEERSRRIDLMPAYGVPVSFEVTEEGIRYVDVDCPDHICEKTGIIFAEGQTAVCMPNRVAVVIR